MAVELADLPAEFAAVDAATADLWIGVATDEVPAQKFRCKGVNPDSAIILLASHYLKLAGEGTNAAITSGGVIVSESRGGKSVTAKVGTAADGPHGSTPYGRAYDRLDERVSTSRRRHIFPAPQPA